MSKILGHIVLSTELKDVTKNTLKGIFFMLILTWSVKQLKFNNIHSIEYKKKND